MLPSSSSSSCTCACLISLHPGHRNERVDVSIAPARKKTSVTESATDEARTMLLLAYTHIYRDAWQNISLLKATPQQIMGSARCPRNNHQPATRYAAWCDVLRAHLLLVLSHNQSNCVGPVCVCVCFNGIQKRKQIARSINTYMSTRAHIQLSACCPQAVCECRWETWGDVSSADGCVRRCIFN